MRYSARFELKNATFIDLTTLWSEAERRGFTDVLLANDGRRFRMLPGDYNITTQLDLATVHRMAKEAANATGRPYAVIVSEAPAQIWEGLDEI